MRSRQHYFASEGRLRPDVVIRFSHGEVASATIVEIKHSDKAGYLIGSGLAEAHLYRHEFASVLNGWPKAILVVPAGVTGLPLASDDVIVIDWQNWWPPGVAVTADGLVLT